MPRVTRGLLALATLIVAVVGIPFVSGLTWQGLIDMVGSQLDRLGQAIANSSIWPTGPALIGVFVAAYLVYIFLQRRSITRMHQSSLLHSHGDPDKLQQLKNRVGAGGMSGGAEAEYFRLSLLDPSRLNTRITQHIETLNRSLQVQSTVTVNREAVPRKVKGSLLLPLVMVERGRLADALTITDAGGDRRSSATQSDYAIFAAACTRRLVRNIDRGLYRRYRNPRPDAPAVEQRVVEVLSAKQPMDPDDFTSISNDILALSRRHQEALFEIVKLVEGLAQTYPICIKLTPKDLESELRFTVEYRETPPMRERSLKRVWRAVVEYFPSHPISDRKLGDWLAAMLRAPFDLAMGFFEVVLGHLRHLLGIKSNILAYRIHSAARGGSYHLRVRGPEQTFVAGQELVLADGSPPPAQMTAGISHQASELVGQRNTHLYVSGAPADAHVLYFRTRFFEVTPGSMARALIAALLTLALVIVIALPQLRGATEACLAASPTGVCDPSSAVAIKNDSGLLQALLVFPLGLSLAALSSSSMWGGVLAARLANIATILLGFAALYVSAVPSSMTVQSLRQVWLAIGLSLAALTVGCLGSWLFRANAHARYIGFARDEQ